MDRTRPPAPSPDAVTETEHTQLTAEDTRRLLQRAAELERPASRDAEPSLDLREIERIGAEAGLSREAIQRAFIELRTGALDPAPKPGLADRLIGPESVSAQAMLPLPPEDARRKLHAILKSELLHPEERKGERTVWSPTPGLWAAIQRGINWQSRPTWHRGSVISQVLPAPPGIDARSIVKLEAQPGGRTGQLVGALAPLLSMLPVVVISALAPQGIEQGVPLIVGGISLAATAFTWTMIRYGYRKRLRSLRASIERVLEKMTGDPNEP